MTQQEVEKPDISELASICKAFIVKHATSYASVLKLRRSLQQLMAHPRSLPSNSEHPQEVAMNSRQPDLCVGIDFGSTYTAVSWSTPKEKSTQINIISQWPGEARRRDKVPTVLAKDVSGGEARWGFLCEDLVEARTWRFFKFLLVPGLHEKLSTSNRCKSQVPGTIDQVHELVALYLRQIYTHISNEIPKLIKTDHTFSEQLRLKSWDSLTIDFIFSAPTTWQAPVCHSFRRIVSKAGFGEQKLHRVVLGPMEAEAAVVFTCQPKTVGQVRKDDVVLSIDAGGATTNVSFLNATADANESLTLGDGCPLTGVNLGSTSIDSEFAKLIEDRIKKHPKARSELPENFAFRASESDDFQACKHALRPRVREQSDDKFDIEVAGLEESYNNQDLGIQRGRLSFTRSQLESCFDKTLQEIKDLIERALAGFEGRNRFKGIVRRVNCVVLSGGLGNSDYVLNELTTYFNDLAKKPNSRIGSDGFRVFRIEGDAGMVVANGLVYGRGTEPHALKKYIARANYGIIVEEPRSKESARYPKGPTIRWLVKEGDTIQVGKPITVDITKRLEWSDQRKWTEKIVWLRGTGMSDFLLPEKVKDGWDEGMRELHSVEVEVGQGAKLSSGARTWWGKPATYDECHFKLSLAVGPSGDCDVEVWENVIKRSEQEALKR